MTQGVTPASNKGPKACTTCARAKARCIPGPDGSLKCERCHRLDKACISQTPAPPRARRSPKLSKIAALEKRLEELSSHVHEPSKDTVSPSPTPSATKKALFETDEWHFDHLFPDQPNRAKQVDSITVVRLPEKPRPWESWWPTPSEADVLLEHYVSLHAEIFPFVVVPEKMSAMEMRQSRPFLWKAIMMVSCFLDGSRQVKLGEELLAAIGHGAVVDGLKSLDLLHGLQILVAWFHYALKGPQVTNLLFLARSMCVNLNSKDVETMQGKEKEKNLDHMRAYAGTYYINALIQQLAQSISLTMAIDNISQHAMKLPLTMVVSSFQDQLDAFRNSLSPQLAGSDTLKCHISIAEVLLNEIALSDQHSSASYVPLTDRLQLLWACLRSLTAFFDIRFSRRELERPRFICLSASDFAFALITGLKLLTLQLPGWNLAHIHAELDMCAIMDGQIRDLMLIIMRRKQGAFPGATAGAVPREDPFERLLRQLKTLRDLAKLELERLNTGTGMDFAAFPNFSQDELMGDLDSEFWQGIGSDNVGSIVGDPAILDSMS
ncbi:hypothetical protein G7046_g295 [Stylonectria norvegica]|nr:hypothetical protein G7046_g295 [Stylonectria norvegica]